VVGKVTLKAMRAMVAAHRSSWTVVDTGPGIAPDALAQIWAPFYTTKAEGTGIGLSIVRSLVEQQTGTAITVESRLGVGTTFRLTIRRSAPLPPGERQLTQKEQAISQHAAPQTVLVVDDDAEMRDVFSEYIACRLSRARGEGRA